MHLRGIEGPVDELRDEFPRQILGHENVLLRKHGTLGAFTQGAHEILQRHRCDLSKLGKSADELKLSHRLFGLLFKLVTWHAWLHGRETLNDLVTRLLSCYHFD